MATLSGVPSSQADEPSAATPTSEAAAASDDAAAAHLALMGKRDVRLHDPSSIAKCGEEYWFFTTGHGVPSYRSRDLRTWTRGPATFAEPPAWVAEAVPENKRGHFWAPDIVEVDGRYVLYYSVSSFGSNNSVIALATNATLDPDDPRYRWVDEGVVVRSTPADSFNAIDPGVSLDAEGRLWMTFGSFWSGIKLVELDRRTGRRAEGAAAISLAYNQTIEGPFIHRRGNDYFLFVAWGWCCRGLNSTYEIRVGRSRSITGPYLDKDGRDMAHGGGTLLLGTDGVFIGPGQPGVSVPDGRELLTCHFYDGTANGAPTLAIRPITWDAAGWPVVERDGGER